MTTHVQKTGEAATKAHSPALIGMTLRQDIPGEVLSSRARFRFSCRTILKPRNPAAKKKAANVEVSPSAVSQNLTRFTLLSPSAILEIIRRPIDFFVATGVLLITAHKDCSAFQTGARV